MGPVTTRCVKKMLCAASKPQQESGAASEAQQAMTTNVSEVVEINKLKK